MEFRKNTLPILFLLAILTALVLIVKWPIEKVVEYNVDEGIDSMASLLIQKGFSLYKDIWYEHPPLVPITLSYWFKLFGPSIPHARILMCIFTTIFLFAFYRTIKLLWGDFCALIAVIFLLLSALFLRLDISVMLCTPARTLAMLSIYCITLYKKSEAKYLLILSGIFMALSLQAKLIFLFLVPIILFEIVQINWKIFKSEKKLNIFFYPLLLWLFSFSVVYLSIIAIFFHSDFSLIPQQLIYPHLKELTIPGSNFPIIWDLIQSDYDIALLALIGIILLIRQRKWQFFFPVLWLGIALFILAIYKPVWEHYYLLVSIPICWLAAISFSEFFRMGRLWGWFFNHNVSKKFDVFLHWFTAGVIILNIINLPMRYHRLRNSIERKTTPQECGVINLLSKYKNTVHWIFTDRPTFAFYANILIPPELVVITEKRDLTQTYCIDRLEKYKPELIILENLRYFGPQVISYIQKNYSEIYQTMLPEKIRDYSDTPLYVLTWHWEPIGKYLPKRIQIITDKWVYNMIWHSIHIPMPAILEYQYFWQQLFVEDKKVRIFMRKNYAENKKSDK